MIRNLLPDPKKFQYRSKEIGNAIIWANSTSSYYYPNHESPYLFLANFEGVGNYHLNGRSIAISDRFFYLINAGDDLEIMFQRNQSRQTVIVMFASDLIREISDVTRLKTEQLLDNFGFTDTGLINVPAIPFEYSKIIRDYLSDLKLNGISCENGHDDFFYQIADSLFSHATKESDKLCKIPAIRKSTRQELYRRVLLGKTFMEDSLTNPVRLDKISNEACLNKFHFLKLFKAIYGISPHQYVTKLKLDKARQLLNAGKHSVVEVCQMIGFESQGSFTNLYKRHFGVAPSIHRTRFEVQ